jgi:hypothetical protein
VGRAGREADAQQEWGRGDGPTEHQGLGGWAENQRWPKLNKKIPSKI